MTNFERVMVAVAFPIGIIALVTALLINPTFTPRPPVRDAQVDSFYMYLGEIHTHLKTTTAQMHILCVDIGRVRGFTPDAAKEYCTP